MRRTRKVPRHLWRGLLCASALAMGTASCGSDTAEQAGASPFEGENCVSNEQFFLKEVWTPILEKQCYNCHNPQGEARDTNMVYTPPGQVGFLEANLEIFAEMAEFERNGKSLLSAKPMGDFDHGGGAVLTPDSADLATLQTMIARTKNPPACREVLEQTDFFDGVVLLTPEETLRKTTLNLAGRLPTEDEEALVEEGGIQALDPALDRLMNEDAFFSRIEEIFNDMFLTDRYLGGNNAVSLLNTDYYPNARWYDEDGAADGEDPAFFEAARQHTNNSVAREPLKLVSFIIRNNMPFTDVIGADYMVVNPFTARVYGVDDVEFDDPTNPDEWRMGKVPGVPHAGVLTSPMFLNRFPTTDTNRNRHRSRIVYDFFIATDVLKLAERPIDPTSAAHNPTMNDPQCAVCHAVVDPVAGAFQNWDAQGNYNPPDQWYTDMRPPGYGKLSIATDDNLESLTWLALQITADKSFDISVVYVIFKALTGHQPMQLPRTENSENYDVELEAYTLQQKFLDKIAREFRLNNHDVKTVIKAIATSPWYRAARSDSELDDVLRIQYANLGTGRLLTPEMLDRKIIATTGYRWTPRLDRANYLRDRDQYRLLYGGIDSNDVTERITEPNGIIASIQQRMANEMACLTVSRDFSLDIGQRRYFKDVEMSYVPEDEHGFRITQAESAIKRNIQHLHWHFLGERIGLSGPEMEIAYGLFYDTWKEGTEGIANEELAVRLPSPCQSTRDLFTGRDLPDERRVIDDRDYTVRAWMAVTAYLLGDYKFLYE